ncbi:galactose oxidase [Mucilaginibacter sp.]|uniref:galactose oxidase n=1 Tax=Mucilaginibacter sp. TaxID=1882438 RepID=UPI002622CDED|nr:galactose oxidase [Mucilaginibacter sp.]MDB4920682.1 galactose oxidase [Mucilaginibacter sp.]
MRLSWCFFKVIVSLFFVVAIFTHDSYGQSYGLGFYSHEVVQDKRTSLDLSPEKTLCFKDNFEISFDLTFYPNRAIYFGYIIRIIENDHRNIDLVYNAQATKNHFNLIVGDKLTKTAFDIDPKILFSQWNKLSIKFDYDHNKIVFSSGSNTFIENNIQLKKNSCYKILFGVNNYKQFQTTDVPPMKLRDIRISQNGLLKYNWPLNEEHGQAAHELYLQSDGVVTNPLWITAQHHDWQPAQTILINGAASVAFDPKNEQVYVVGSDSTYRYTVGNSQWSTLPYSSGKLILNQGNQSVFNPYDNNLYNFYLFLSKRFIAKYNITTHAWDKKFEAGDVSDFWHLNKSISTIDTSLYLFGGYGHLVYKNNVQQYHFNSHIWENVVLKGDFFMPRYLAALGATQKGDTVYILGGYGNSSGQQILNPKNMYDMLRFTVKDKTFKKMFTLKESDEDFALANSLVIDAHSNSYYGLIFPQHKYNSTLQLIHGSLTKPAYTLVGNSIPYNFHDTHSFADLYYCEASKKFIAVTLLRSENNQTKINIYTLLSPPYGSGPKTLAARAANYWYSIAFIILITLMGLFVIVKRRKKTASLLSTSVANAGTPSPAAPVSAEINKVKIFNGEEQYKNSIFLFGDLQVFDAEGVDITKYFTPLIKELFLVILLYSIKRGRGLSSEKLNEILWYDKDAKSARNNRSVNIAKLKNLLDKLGYCSLSKNTGYWKIDIDYNHIYVDYHNYLNIVRDKDLLDIERIKLLSAITQRGNFLLNNEYEWLDSFKSEISNEVIDTYLHYAHSLDAAHNAELLIEIAGYIFYFDPVNEEATVLKCKALSLLGKHSLAKNTFENFIKEYKTIYGEDFKKDFHAILE